METLVTVIGAFKAKWEGLSSSVRSEFSLPAARLVCCFGDEPYLDPVCRESWRGVFRPIKANGNGDWPSYIRCEFPRHDALIYLPGSTCSPSADVLFVMALAHEFRHFEQWGSEPQLLRDCETLSNEPKLATKNWPLPTRGTRLAFQRRLPTSFSGGIEWKTTPGIRFAEVVTGPIGCSFRSCHHPQTTIGSKRVAASSPSIGKMGKTWDSLFDADRGCAICSSATPGTHRSSTLPAPLPLSSVRFSRRLFLRP